MDSDNPFHKGFLIYTTSIVHTSIIDYPHIPSQGTFEDDIQFPKVGYVIVPWRVHVNVFFLDPHVLWKAGHWERAICIAPAAGVPERSCQERCTGFPLSIWIHDPSTQNPNLLLLRRGGIFLVEAPQADCFFLSFLGNLWYQPASWYIYMFSTWLQVLRLKKPVGMMAFGLQKWSKSFFAIENKPC